MQHTVEHQGPPARLALEAPKPERQSGQDPLLRPAPAVAAALVVAFAVAVALGGPEVRERVSDALLAAASIGAAAACLRAARRPYQQRRTVWVRLRKAWTFLAAAAISWAVSHLAWAVYTWWLPAGGAPLGLGLIPALNDLGYLLTVPFATLGVLAFPTAEATPPARARVLLDGAIIATSLLFISWALVLGPMFHGSPRPVDERVLAMAYPLGDVLAVTAILATLARYGRETPLVLRLVAVALVAILAADSGFAALNQEDSYRAGSLLDVGWLVGFLLLALAAMQSPSAKEVPLTSPLEPATRAALLLPYLPLAGVLVVGVLTQASVGQLEAPLVYLAAVAGLLAGARQVATTLESRHLNERLREQVQALSQDLERERRARQELAATDAMKDTFLQAVSHDLRTPLTAILGLAVTLQRAGDRLPREQSSHLLYMLVEKARKLDRMLTDLLDLNRMERGLLEPNRTPTDIGAMVRRLCSELDQLEGRPVHIDADPIVAAVDAPKVERIIENLLVNTCKHTPQGTPVWVRLVPGNGRDLEILVEDAGPGVPPELQADIFEPFRQGPDATRRQPGGLGLTLVSRFAQLHGGRAWVTDRDGGGASFHVLLPGAIVEDEYPHPVFDPSA